MMKMSCDYTLSLIDKGKVYNFGTIFSTNNWKKKNVQLMGIEHWLYSYSRVFGFVLFLKLPFANYFLLAFPFIQPSNGAHFYCVVNLPVRDFISSVKKAFHYSYKSYSKHRLFKDHISSTCVSHLKDTEAFTPVLTQCVIHYITS